MSNHLKGQTSPYLLQHSENPVDWYPWGNEAFDKAKREDKPIFLSIGYSTCHWCHVMAHESFENKEIAEILNKEFVSIKVDKEERPDIDSIYMTVCQAFTGSGGWPTSIFITPDKKPFFAGTYFPLNSDYGIMGFKELLKVISERWKSEKSVLLEYAEKTINSLLPKETAGLKTNRGLIKEAENYYKYSYDENFGGFGDAPKFPAAHNLLFLLALYELNKDKKCLNMVEKTLEKMYLGGIYDHIGYGFCRYSTDSFFLVPHFEKMLYDNALLMMAYSKAFDITRNSFYLNIAEKIAIYISREMTSEDGAFYSAQDADCDGEEGVYYVFKPSEINLVLGKQEGEAFNQYYNITKQGNFHGYSIPNLLHTNTEPYGLERYLPKLYEYRRNRNKLKTDDKILTSWNSLMIVAICILYRVSKNSGYLEVAKKAQKFISKNLFCEDTLYVSYRDGKRGEKGFIEDYANYIYALISLYEATYEVEYLKEAEILCNKTIKDFFDVEYGGFYLYSIEHEGHIFRPKEVYDGAMPSGNSVMVYNLVRLFYYTNDKLIEEVMKKQLDFLTAKAENYPSGYAMFLTALLEYFEPPQKIIAVIKRWEDIERLMFDIPLNSIILVKNTPTKEYPYKDDKTTFYVCKGHTCMPPVNNINELLR